MIQNRQYRASSHALYVHFTWAKQFSKLQTCDKRNVTSFLVLAWPFGFSDQRNKNLPDRCSQLRQFPLKPRDSAGLSSIDKQKSFCDISSFQLLFLTHLKVKQYLDLDMNYVMDGVTVPCYIIIYIYLNFPFLSFKFYNQKKVKAGTQHTFERCQGWPF